MSITHIPSSQTLARATSYSQKACTQTGTSRQECVTSADQTTGRTHLSTKTNPYSLTEFSGQRARYLIFAQGIRPGRYVKLAETPVKMWEYVPAETATTRAAWLVGMNLGL